MLKEVRSKRDEREVGLSIRVIKEIKEVSKKVWGKKNKRSKAK